MLIETVGLQCWVKHSVKRETTNPKDKNAVAVHIEETIVGHVPYNIAPYMSRFLKRNVNIAYAKVTGEKLIEELVMD